MKLDDLILKCNELGLEPVPTKRRRNPDRMELSKDDCTKAIREYYLNKFESEGTLDPNMKTMLVIGSPMLATLVTSLSSNIQHDVWSESNYDWEFQRKYNGIRLLIINGPKLSIFSRNVSNDTLLPLEYSKYFDLDLNKVLATPCILDVELVYRNFEDYTEKDIKEAFEDIVENNEKFTSDKFKFVILDCLSIGFNSLLEEKLSDRYNSINYLTKCLKSPESGFIFESVDTKPDNMGKEEFYYSIIDNGGEGVIAKRYDSLYECKRSNNWVKIKPQVKGSLNASIRDTIDAYVSGYHVNEETNKIDSLIFSVYLEDDLGCNKKEFPVAKLYIGSDLQDKVTRFDNNGTVILNVGFYLKVAELSFDLLTQTYLMLHPKLMYWRLDKNSEACVYKYSYFDSLI